MENLKKERKTLRSAATRLEKRVNEEVKAAVVPVDKKQLKWFLEEVTRVLKDLEPIDRQIYDNMRDDEEVSQDDLDKENLEAASYREKLSLAKNVLEELFDGSAMDLLDRLKSKRSELRLTIEDLITRSEGEMAKKSDENLCELETCYKLLQEQLTKEQGLNTEITDAMVDLGVGEEERTAERRENLDRQIKVETVLKQLDKIIHPRGASPTPSTSTSVTSVELDGFEFKLKPVEFDGLLYSWLSWWGYFKEVHESTKMSKHSKLRFLFQCMKPQTRGWKLVNRYFNMEDGYDAAIKNLKDTFGDKQLLTQVYVKNLSRMILQRQDTEMTLSDMKEEIEAQLQCLRSLGVEEKTLGFLFPLIETILPEDMQIAWQRSRYSGYADEKMLNQEELLKGLMEFLRLESKIQERMDAGRDEGKKQNSVKDETQFKKPYDVNKKGVKAKRKPEVPPVPTAAGLTSTKKEKYPCVFCEKTNHESRDCRAAIEMTREEKEKKLEGKRACYKCLIPGHFTNKCNKFVKCALCKGKHYPIMCGQTENYRKRNGGESSSSHNQNNRKVRKDSKSRERSRSRHKSGSRDRRDEGGERRSHAVTTLSSNFSTRDLVLLKTLLVKARGPKGTRCVRLLVDEGSQVSYIGRTTTEVIGSATKDTETVQNVLLGGITTEFHTELIKEVQLMNINNDDVKMTWLLREKPIVCTNLPRIPKGRWIDTLKEKDISVSDVVGTEVAEENVEILIGSDLRAEIMTGRKYELGDNLVAEETIFGWTLSGPVPRERMTVSNMLLSFCLENLSLQDLWSLENLGIKDPIESQSVKEEADEAYKHFIHNMKRDEEGRYSVALPWIDQRPNLPSNREIAYRRLQGTTKKLKVNKMYETYNGLFDAWLDEQFVEEVKVDSDQGRHFLPHHAVIKMTSLTTPVRPVFDASAKCKGSVSLNDCLYKGANLIELIPDVLCRFREKAFGVFSDIRKAFQMIGINEEDRDALSFMWWDSEECKKLKIMRHKRVVFGVRSSPFLLGAVLKYHLEAVQDERRDVALKLLRSLYVDNSTPSVSSVEEYLVFKKTASDLLADCKMVLRQWTCTANSEISANDIEIQDPVIGVLGILWDRVEDSLFIEVKTRPLPVPLTKRILLSEVARIFDPIGFVCPITLIVKLLLQESWKIGVAWDDELNDEYSRKFKDWHNELNRLGSVKIPRRMIHTADPTKLQLHVFVDASKYAMGIVMFMRSETEEGVKVTLVGAKSRVAPLRKNTIPRLELVSCLMGARSLKSVLDSMEQEVGRTFMWTDSITALYWIKEEEQVWGRFVQNRVEEIRSIVPIACWNHIPGIRNPADLPSRGCSVTQLIRSQWWTGPEWLYFSEDQWPTEVLEINEEEILMERKKSSFFTAKTYEHWFKSKYGSFYKNIRVMTWIIRFKTNVMRKIQSRKSAKAGGMDDDSEPSAAVHCQPTKANAKRDPLTIPEMKQGETLLVKEIQAQWQSESEELSRIMRTKDTMVIDGVLCCKTRLDERDDSTSFKWPPLLPGRHPMVRAMILETHLFYGHGGLQFLQRKVREKYFVTGGRRVIKTVLNKCMRCKRFSSRPVEVEGAPLPKTRVTTGEVYETSGVDLAGPIPLIGGEKCWVVLFTCATYRCVHLDVITALSAEAFLLAMERFINQYGRPRSFHSDNGSNFVATANLMRQLDWEKIQGQMEIHRIHWLFNPPAAPWWGGYWERMVKSMKEQMRKMLGKTRLTYEELRTCLSTVQATINDRPLTAVTDDEGDLLPLTPSMFLHPTKSATFPEGDLIDSVLLSQGYKKMRNIQRQLKQRFRDEYLAMLIQKSKKGTKPLEVGDIVLVKTQQKRFEWPLARVIELFPGRDKKVRSAKVQLSHDYELKRGRNGVYKLVKVKPGNQMDRPIQCLYPLELSSPPDFLKPDDKPVKVKRASEQKKRQLVKYLKPVEQPKTTRSGRRPQRPVRYGDWANF